MGAVYILLFGPRGAGKTTYLKDLPFFEKATYINLLRASEENRFGRNPDELLNIAQAIPKKNQDHHIIIDEIQKIPKLLDIVHECIESIPHVKFILTSSSARKLKRDGANLLAGRAFVYQLGVFTYIEIEDRFNLNQSLRWGLLPKIMEYNSIDKKQKYLETYTNTYLKEEIWAEQFVRDLAPFQYFLQVAAQSNGKPINFSNIARDVGISDTTVSQYYAILEDTLLGFFLHPFQHSFRKRLNKSPKFYFFDTGVTRTLAGNISLPLNESTYEYGDLFEQFIILQCMQLANYYHSDFRFSYLCTKDGAEIDLVVERPGRKTLLIEIKSSENVSANQLTNLRKIAEDLGNAEAICFSCDNRPKQLKSITVLPWKQGIKQYFGSDSTST